MTLPKIWKDKEQEPEYFVKFNLEESFNYIVICNDKGERVTDGTLVDKNAVRVMHVDRGKARAAGVTIDNEGKWNKDQCIETLVHYIRENMK